MVQRLKRIFHTLPEQKIVLLLLLIHLHHLYKEQQKIGEEIESLHIEDIMMQQNVL